MVTDINSNYTSPAGKEFTLAAGRLCGLNPASHVLDIGCGYGEGACNLASEFRCKIKAVDISEENLEFARQLSIERQVSHLIQFSQRDILTADYSEENLDLIMAEGGALSFFGRARGMSLIHDWLPSRGWFAFSDLILLSDDTPAEILSIFEHQKYAYETEDSYRKMIQENGFAPHLMCLVPPSGWDNYYAHMARRLEDTKGFFADKNIKLAFHKEIDVFYRMHAFQYVGYLFAVIRKKT
ncbi:MAG: SAM-dependent methyltransferase [Fibrobacterota bacterium]